MRISALWRCIIAFTLEILGAIVITAVRLVVTNPLLVPLFLVVLITSSYAVWLVFTGAKERLIAGWALLMCSLIALVPVASLYTRSEDDFLLLRIVFLSLVYTVLVGVLRDKYWSLKRRVALKEGAVTVFKKPYLIVNPKSGNGRAIKAGIPEKAARMGIKVRVTKKGDNIEQLAREAVKNGVDVLGVSGGDGTIGAVAKVAIEHNLPIAVLPGGTRCHFARDVGLDPKRIEDALACFYGVEQRIDVGSINGRVFLNNASLGLYADIVDNEEYRDNKVATTRATLQKIIEREKGYPISFKDGSGKQYREVAQILVGVNAYKTASLLELGHRASLTGHVLQVTAITKLTDALAKSLMKTAVLNRDFVSSNPDNIKQWETKEFTVTAPEKKMVIGVDGEREEYVTPVKMEVMPNALRLMALPEGLRQRPKGTLSKDLVKNMIRLLRGKDA